MKLLLFITLLSGHGQTYTPQHGDLLFQDLDCGPLCEAIEAVTKGVDGADFSHMGMVVLQDSGVYVLEAISAGVVLTPYESFISRSLDDRMNPKILVGRIKEPYRQYIKAAVDSGLGFLHQVYDTVYLPDNQAYYCSELMYLAFSQASADTNFFQPEPMTFKAPETDQFFPAWEEYYQTMGCDIPEGLPGLNPGGISRSDKIEIVGVLGIPDGYKP